MLEAVTKNERWTPGSTRRPDRLLGFVLLTLGGGASVLWVGILCWSAGWLMNVW